MAPALTLHQNGHSLCSGLTELFSLGVLICNVLVFSWLYFRAVGNKTFIKDKKSSCLNPNVSRTMVEYCNMHLVSLHVVVLLLVGGF